MLKRTAILESLVTRFCLFPNIGIPEGNLLDYVQPGEDGKIDAILVFAHQDDESIYGGGAVLKMMKDPRVRLYIMCLTFDQNSPARENLGISEDHIGRIRVKELEAAAAVYGAEEVIQFMYHHRTLPEVDREKIVADIKEVIDRVDAEIVITHDPAGITGHPDHVTCSSITTEAFETSNAKVLCYPTLPKWAYSIATKFNGYGTNGVPALPDFKVNIKEVKTLKRMACFAHASQMQFSSIGRTTRMQLIPNYEYWTLAAKKDLS